MKSGMGTFAAAPGGDCNKAFEIIRAGEAALWKFQFEWTVVTETRSDMAPLGEQRLIRRATANVAADRHRAQRAAVVALATRDDAEAFGVAALEPVLPCEFYRGFGSFGSAGSEIDAASIAKIWRRECEKSLGKFFGGCGIELRRVRKSDLRSLLGHGLADFGDAMPDANNGRLAGRVEKASTVVGENPRAFAPNCNRQVFAKISGKQC